MTKKVQQNWNTLVNWNNLVLSYNLFNCNLIYN